MDGEWLVVGLICVSPFLLFGGLELYRRHRHNHQRSIARRKKSNG